MARPAPTPIPTMTHREWLAEATRRFGPLALDWRFVCPACGHVASCGDFAELGADPNRAAMNCIGRVLNEQGAPGKRGEWGDKQPCNWSAGGLLGTLNGGVIVTLDGGDTTNVFSFAEPDQPPVAANPTPTGGPTT